MPATPVTLPFVWEWYGKLTGDSTIRGPSKSPHQQGTNGFVFWGDFLRILLTLPWQLTMKNPYLGKY